MRTARPVLVAVVFAALAIGCGASEDPTTSTADSTTSSSGVASATSSTSSATVAAKDCAVLTADDLARLGGLSSSASSLPLASRNLTDPFAVELTPDLVEGGHGCLWEDGENDTSVTIATLPEAAYATADADGRADPLGTYQAVTGVGTRAFSAKGNAWALDGGHTYAVGFDSSLSLVDAGAKAVELLRLYVERSS
jgi:hypothetical protein